MPNRTMLTVITCCLAVLALLTLAFLPSKVRHGEAAEGTPPAQIELTGIVRDFLRDHPDFGEPAGTPGHSAGTVAHQLDGRQRPSYAAGGRLIQSDWRDASGRPFAPHLYIPPGPPAGVVPLVIPTEGPKPDTILDTWDSRLGPYDPLTAGPAPTFPAGSPMPAISAPTSLTVLPNDGNVSLLGGTLDRDMHCDQLVLDNAVVIEGRIGILCNGALSIQANCEIDLRPGASLTFYLENGGQIDTWGSVNENTSDPSRLRINNIGAAPLELRNHADLYARIVSPQALLRIDNHAELFGTFIGSTIDFQNHGSLHLDVAPELDACDNLLADVAGVAGEGSTGGVLSSDSFGQWYRDVLGTNMSTTHTIVLDRSADGVYEYLNDAFHPIDDQLQGNEDEAHNSSLTYAVEASFTYDACAGQFFEFEGGDGAWLFIDGQLVIDLGGIAVDSNQFADLDRLDLEDGSVQTMRLFYAQRRSSSTVFRLRTNVQLDSASPKVVNQQYD